jgi:hypothetical protein
MQKCESLALKALLCRRPLLHVFPCCALWIILKSLKALIDNYENTRLASTQPVEQRPTSKAASSLPPGLPPCVAAALVTPKLPQQTEMYDYIWERATFATKILFEGRDSFARVA